MNNIDYTKMIDWILRIIQITTFLGVVFKISFKKNEYSTNVRIERINKNQFASLNDKFTFIHTYEHIKNQNYIDYFILYPSGVDLINLQFFELEYKNNNMFTILTSKHVDYLNKATINTANYFVISNLSFTNEEKQYIINRFKNPSSIRKLPFFDNSNY